MASVTHPFKVRGASLAMLACLLLFFAAVAWFLVPNLIESRTEKPLAYLLHIAGGSVVLLTGPFQFVASIRNRYRRYHKAAGYAYVGGTAAAVIGFVLIAPGDTDMFLLSQVTAMTIWVVCVAVAVSAIRRKHVLTHQHNMARSLVVAAYFVTVRIVDQHLMWVLTPFASVEGARLAHSDWLAWVVPLLLLELWFGRKWDRLLRKRERQPRALAANQQPLAP